MLWFRDPASMCLNESGHFTDCNCHFISSEMKFIWTTYSNLFELHPPLCLCQLTATRWVAHLREKVQAPAYFPLLGMCLSHSFSTAFCNARKRFLSYQGHTHMCTHFLLVSTHIAGKLRNWMLEFFIFFSVVKHHRQQVSISYGGK